MKTTILLTVFVFWLFNAGFAQQKTTITGSITTTDTTRVLQLYSSSILKNIAQAKKQANNTFYLEFRLEYADFVTLKLKDTRKWVYFVVHPGENLHLNVDFDQRVLQTDSVTDAHKTFVLAGKLSDINRDKKMSYYERKRKQEQLVLGFMHKYPESIVQIPFLHYLDVTEHATLCKNNLMLLQQKYPNNYWVSSMEAIVLSDSLTAVGAVVPEVFLTDTAGNVIGFEKFRGSVLLIDFWAAWCKPCRKENPHLVKLHNELHTAGFKLVSISLDRQRESWLKAIQKDQLQQWTHLSDLKGWQSDAAKMFNVKAIPYNVLVNKQGRIAAKNLHGMVLERKIKKLLKE